MPFERRTLTLMLALVIGSTACADFRRGEYWEQDETGDTGDTADGGEGPGYAADIHPLLDSGCERCHAAGKSAGNTDFLIVSADTEASYASALDFVDTGDPGSSRLLSKCAGQGHGGGVIFDESSDEYALILAWIDAGAPP